MEITIGIKHIARELSVEVSEEAEAVSKLVADALTDLANGNAGAMVNLKDTKKGHIVLVPAASLAYVELGDATPRPVGFGKN